MNPQLHEHGDTPVGIGLKSVHLAQILGSARVDLDFFEVHAENYMSAGGPMLARLDMIRDRHALSIHGVGLSIGGPDALDADHLTRLKRLLQRFEPQWFSEHLAWSSHGGHFFNDLLPLPYTGATLARVCAHVDQAQEALGRRLLLENPSTYLAFEDSTYEEADFISQVQRRTGCGLLLDVNNAYVSAINHGRCALSYLKALPLAQVGEIHLAGFAEDSDAAGARLLIDHHGSPVAREVWSLYQEAIALTGAVPTLIERDNEVPAFEVLQQEAWQARETLRASLHALRSAA